MIQSSRPPLAVQDYNMLTIFSLDWLSPDFSGSENDAVLVLDLVKTLLLKPHTAERNFSTKEIFS